MKVNFLDVVVKIKNRRLSTDLYSKIVDNYQYLHYYSCHAEHKNKLESNFKVNKNLLREKNHVEEVKGWFLRRNFFQ